MIREEILQHYGILGMKWGIRKKSDISINKSEDRKKVDDILKKRFDEMTDQEMSTAINRYLKEAQLKQFTKKPPSFSSKIMSTLGKTAVKTGTGLAISNLIEKYSSGNTKNDKVRKLFLQNLLQEINKK